jgi:acyl-CoA reductase-like NAD-dependent aldehyde dehydrogenase
MTLQGHSLIAGEAVAGTSGTAYGYNPATKEQLEPAYTLISEQQLKTATDAAADAFDSFSTLEPEQHARFLEAIAENIEAIGDELIVRAGQETGLPASRLQGERARTTGQLRLFANVVRQGRLPRRPYRPGDPGPGSPAPGRYPAAPGPARPRGRLRRQQLSAGLLDGGRRHRLRVRGRLPR